MRLFNYITLKRLIVWSTMSSWLEGGAGDMGTEDCNLVSKVIATIMKNSTLCYILLS